MRLTFTGVGHEPGTMHLPCMSFALLTVISSFSAAQTRPPASRDPRPPARGSASMPIRAVHARSPWSATRAVTRHAGGIWDVRQPRCCWVGRSRARCAARRRLTWLGARGLAHAWVLLNAQWRLAIFATNKSLLQISARHPHLAPTLHSVRVYIAAQHGPALSLG